MKSDKSIKLEYALKSNKLVHISEVDSGFKCGCICPCCGAKLIARKGNKVVHHFAHYNADECFKGYETILHIWAKEILSEYKSIKGPEVFFGPNEMKFKEMSINYDFVELEKKLDDIKPDVVAYKENKQMLIEIYVTHKIDKVKKEKIKKMDISTLEIDLSDINRSISKDELRDIILNDTKRKHWIHNRALDDFIRNHENKLISLLSKHKIKEGEKHWQSQYVTGCLRAKRRNWRISVYGEFGFGCSDCEYFNGFSFKEEIMHTMYKENFPYHDEQGYYDNDGYYYNENKDIEGKGYYHIFDKRPDCIYCGFKHKIKDFESYTKAIKT